MPWADPAIHNAACRRRRQTDHEHVRKIERASRARDPKRTILNRAREQAKARGIAFQITAGDLEWPAYCPVLGILLDYSRSGGQKAWANPSVDRWDNSLGYVPGNVFVISWKANFIKRHWATDELVAVAAYALTRPLSNP